MAAIKTAYLAAYNAASAVGWAYIIYQIGQYYAPQVSKLAGQPQVSPLDALTALDHSGLYASIHSALDFVQTAAILEIIHAAVGLVKSPVATTFLQGA